jgi:hypothetical protein
VKTAYLKIKKTIKAKVVATCEKVKITLPKQSLGCIAVYFKNQEKEVLLKQFELFLCDGGETLKGVAL